MNELLAQWIGYLANPLRMADIHVELHPQKERVFRLEYLALTGESLLLSGNHAPFYVWMANVNKRGIQRRIYFCGESDAMPNQNLGFDVKSGRQKTGMDWRINNKDFLTHLFKFGFVIGKNNENMERIIDRMPGQYMNAFWSGFNLMTPTEYAEDIIRKQCEDVGIRTIELSEVRTLLKQKIDINASGLDAIIQRLQTKKVFNQNSNKGVLTANPSKILMLKGEIEGAYMRQAIKGERHPDKREHMIETFARDAGWKKLAKQTFGDRCMCQNCTNTFIKENGELYVEVHHIIPLYKGGEDGIWNLSVLCAHHHRMAHFARPQEKSSLEEYLLQQNKAVCGS